MCSHWPHKLTWRAFFCTIIAAFTFTAVMNTDLGSGLSPGGSVVRDSLVLNIASTDGMHTWRYADFAWAAILGVLGGVLGAGCAAAIVLTLTLTLPRRRRSAAPCSRASSRWSPRRSAWLGLGVGVLIPNLSPNP